VGISGVRVVSFAVTIVGDLALLGTCYAASKKGVAGDAEKISHR
jgi:hypothetical protein